MQHDLLGKQWWGGTYLFPIRNHLKIKEESEQVCDSEGQSTPVGDGVRKCDPVGNGKGESERVHDDDGEWDFEIFFFLLIRGIGDVNFLLFALDVKVCSDRIIRNLLTLLQALQNILWLSRTLFFISRRIFRSTTSVRLACSCFPLYQCYVTFVKNHFAVDPVYRC